jgi:hypothetical protein
LTEMEITPDRDPDEDAMMPHFDIDDAAYVDENGPAFGAPEPVDAPAEE